MLFLGLCFVGFLSAEPFFYKLILETFEQAAPLSQIFLIIGGWFIVAVMISVSRYIYSTQLLDIAEDDWRDYIFLVMRKFQSLPLEYHRNVHAGEKQKILDQSGEAVWSIADSLMLQVFPLILSIIILTIGGVMIDPLFTLIAYAFLPFWLWGMVFFGGRAYTRQDAAHEKWKLLFNRFLDGFINLTVIRSFSRTKREERELKMYVKWAQDAQYSVRRNWAEFNAFGRFLSTFAMIITLSAGIVLLKLELTTLPTFFFFIAFTSRLYSPIMEIFQSIQNMMERILYYEKAKAVLALESETDKGKQLFHGIKKELRFQDVSFHYPSNDREVLGGVNFTIKKWQKVALVGHTGSGKSTITQLLLRFYDTKDGGITIDGTEISDFTLESYRAQIGTVFQDTTLFNSTIRHNLEYVRDDITEAEIRKACKNANILEFIDSLPQGFDTEVGERGLKLSGGEKQRIAIARVMLSDPDILILDEATSALDTKTERHIQQALENLMKWRTSIVIAHRLSTIQNVDTIFLMDKGSIIASGSHDELYASSPAYKEMVDLQHDGFVGEDETSDSDSIEL
jgi:ABC-type multidrug transport system fused ATPase/permease subunit